MKKLVHIIQSMNKGGAEKLILELALQSVKLYNVTVICQYNQIDADFKSQLCNAGVTVILLNKTPGLSPAAFKKLYSVLKGIKPDIIHTHLQAAIYAIPYYITHKHVVRIHTIHSIPSMEFTKFHMLVQAFAYRFLKVVPVAISEIVRKQTAQLYKLPVQKIKCILNAVNTDKFSKKAHTPNKNFKLINVASFSPWKNQSLIVNALSILNDGTQCVFAGDGELRTNVENDAKKLGVERFCHFLGNIDDVAQKLDECDAFVLSSTFEGIPMSIIEAYASGLPVIATNVGSISNLVENGVNGYLCETRNAEDMAQKINKLKSDVNKYREMSECNIKKSQSFDISCAAKKYFELYEG